MGAQPRPLSFCISLAYAGPRRYLQTRLDWQPHQEKMETWLGPGVLDAPLNGAH